MPSAATVSVTVKLLLALQDFTGTVLLPLNSRVLLDGSSNRIGVSSILDTAWRANGHTAAEVRSRTDGTGWSFLPDLVGVAGPELS